MKEEQIQLLLKRGAIRPKQTDEEKIKSLIHAIIIDVEVAKNIVLSEKTARVIFREMYEAIRQLGDASWWRFGYEPLNHEVSMEILEGVNIKERFKLNYLRRFKQIRHDLNYRGSLVTQDQVREIIDFWDSCSKEIIDSISRLKK